MIIISIVLYIIFSLIIYGCTYENLRFSKFIQFFFIITITSNVLILEGMSLFHVLSIRWIFMCIQMIICGVISFLLLKKSKVSLPSLWIKIKSIQFPSKRIDRAMIILIGIVLCAFFIVGITTPPNNSDSLDPTHLTRIFYWIQQHSIDSTSLNNIANLTKPINVHLQGLWLFLIGGSENLFFLVQWFSLIVVIVSVYDIARSLGFSSTQSLVSSIVCISFPIALLQTYSSQGDLTVAALIITSISLALSYNAQKRWVDIIGAILALSLALGTKNTAFLTLPVIGLSVIVYLIKTREFKKTLPWVGAGLLILILTTGFHFIKNIKETGYIFGVKNIMADPALSNHMLEKSEYNIPRYIYTFIGFDGLPRVIQNELNQTKASIFKFAISPLNIDLESELYLQPGADDLEFFSYSAKPVLSDDQSWFGPLAFLLIIPALVVSLFSKQKQRRNYALFAFSLFISFFMLVLLQRPGWDPYQGRYFLLAIIPLVPLVSILIPRNKIIQSLLIWIVFIFSALISLNTFVSNDSKPIITVKTYEYLQREFVDKLPDTTKAQKYVKKHIPLGLIAPMAHPGWSIYHYDYIHQVYFANPVTGEEILWINSLVPEDEPLYITTNSIMLEYGLFGKNKSRDLFPVTNVTEVESGYYLTSYKIDGGLPENIMYLGSNGELSIYFVSPGK